MTLKITFCGVNPELNETLLRHTKDLIGNEVVDVVTLPNPVQQVIEYTHKSDWKGHELDWLNLYSGAYRAINELGAQDADMVLSASCHIDQVALQAAWVADQVERSQKTSKLLYVEGGEEKLYDNMAMINRSGSVLQVLLNQAEEAVAEYWDFIYAVVPVALGISMAPDIVLAQYDDFLSSVPAFEAVNRLPDNESSAIDALEQEVVKWKEKLKPPN